MSDFLGPLKAVFRARVAEDVERLLTLWPSEPGSAELRRLVHDLAGTAGIFGYGGVSEAALAIDDCYVAGLQPDEGQIQLLIARLREVGV